MNKFAQLILFIGGVLMLVSQFARIFSSRTHMSGQSIMLVTAHPDDEAMFFGPTLRHIVDPKKGNNVHLLVMSNGNSEGLGLVREQEQYAAAIKMGIPAENVVVIDDARLPDSMTTEWDPSIIEQHVDGYIELWKPSTVITFDDYGVSEHTNHIATYKGVLLSCSKVALETPEFSMMTLYSVPLWRKYLFTVDNILSKVITNVNLQYQIIMSPAEYHAISTALNAHVSQMTWYRRLWTAFSRYMVVNELGEVNFGKALRSENFEKVDKDYQVLAWEQRERAQNRKTRVEKPQPTVSSKPGITRQKPNFAATVTQEEQHSGSDSASDSTSVVSSATTTAAAAAAAAATDTADTAADAAAATNSDIIHEDL